MNLVNIAKQMIMNFDPVKTSPLPPSKGESWEVVPSKGESWEVVPSKGEFWATTLNLEP
jgi:hypothetical protein